MRVLVTGASGFLGRAITAAGAEAGLTMIAATRKGVPVEGASECVATGDLSSPHAAPDFGGIDTVIHCAARVHVTKRENPKRAATQYEIANAAMPFTLATKAKEAGVHRFVQISSVAAIASTTPPGEVLSDESQPAPTTPYGQAKLAADIALAELVDENFAVISLRPPAIYGPQVGAWFARLARAAKSGVPLPVGGIDNLRSFAFVGNVADAVIAAARAPSNKLQSGSFIVTDSPPVSTAWLYRQMLAHYGYGDRAWSWPPAIARILAQLALGDRAQSLLGNAAFDGSRFQTTFDWQPRWTMDDALRLMLTAS